MEELKELKEIIYNYNDLMSCWMDGEDGNLYADNSDDLRNRAIKILENLEKKF